MLELLEIRVDLMSGGLQLIRVADNGTGIPGAELQLALSRHATSKVARIDDLEHIRSLGFGAKHLQVSQRLPKLPCSVIIVAHHRGRR